MAEIARPSNSRLKIVAIPVLAAVLIYLLVPADSDAPVELATSAPTLKPAAATNEAPAAPPASRHTGPLPELANLLAADPFKPLTEPNPSASASTASGSDAQAVRQDELAASAKNFRVSAIYHSDAGPVALVGNRFVRIGDELAPNMRVIAIGAEGIQVSAE